MANLYYYYGCSYISKKFPTLLAEREIIANASICRYMSKCFLLVFLIVLFFSFVTFIKLVQWLLLLFDVI